MRALAVFLAMAFPASAQEVQPAGPEFSDSQGAELRFLDKLTSETGDVELGVGQAAKFGRLVVQLDSCRFPTGNPASDAEAHLTILEETTNTQLFAGWMLASSPALSALDHPRYDVWVLNCVLPEARATDATDTGDGE
ncbi:DUF2155 domain-containing protein [Tabrizicola sp.]|uniref:DUF2155 domain-containing protein n=1 Tax=Tabrizicola sp. TaxID=2005166 RepID=UPI002736CAFE|nr:DUF2155 domain-containing protein [Tabrizicola sp.]MDP3195728.1 DUF2155 domain-containing protein [Tabrizicola sp.]